MDMTVTKKLSRKKKLLELASALETAAVYDDASRFDLVVDAAAQLKDLVALESVSLSRADKIQVLKTFTKAKVRAFMGGSADSYRTFRTLETISSDLVKML
jgi:hypothetical protein